jgi:hypothetical protein
MLVCSLQESITPCQGARWVPSEGRKYGVDDTTFDTLIKRLATTRLTRLQTLRGLAAGGVAALTGMSLLGEEGEAKKNNPKKRKVCLCSPASCTTKRVKNRARVIRRNAPCAYKGKCTSFNPCAAAVTTPVPLAPLVPVLECTSNAECDGQLCIGNECVGGEACESDTECPSPLECIEDEEGDERCLLPDQGLGACDPVEDSDCPEDLSFDDEEIDSFCLLGACVLPCGEACDEFDGECEAGICVDFDPFID